MLKEQSAAKRAISILVAVAIIVLGCVVPAPESLGQPGLIALSVLVAGVVLWVTEPVPMIISGVALMPLPYLLGAIDTLGVVWTNYISSAFFFLLACFGLSTALMKTKLPKKLVFSLTRLSKGNPNKVVVAVLWATALCSWFISDIPATALFASIAASSILAAQKADSTSGLGKALMIGIPLASCVGGFALPCGSSMNILALSVASSQGVEIGFLQWAIVAVPCSIVCMVFLCFGLCRVFKPERLTPEAREAVRGHADNAPLDTLDKKVIVIFAVLVAAWIASNWTGWNATILAIFACAVLFLPGIDVLTWQEYIDHVYWQVVLLMGCVTSIAGNVASTGAGKWVLSMTIAKVALSAAAFIGISAIVLPLLRILVPVAAAFIAVAEVPLMDMAVQLGLPASAMVFIVVLGGFDFVLGIDANNMISHQYGYWNMGEFFKGGLWAMLGGIVCNIALVVPLCNLAGLA